MNLLDANDRRGHYPDSWYAATAEPMPAFETLRGAHRADLCVVGGGYTGLSAALHAAQAGRSVIVLDAQRVGFGASGRNGGQVGARFNLDQRALEATCGADDARRLHDLALEAAALTRTLAATHAPDAGYRPGVIHADRFQSELADTHASIAHLQDRYASTDIEALDREQIASLIGTDVYAGGALDMAGGHLHPLRYALGLARACHAAGVQIFELSRVHRLDHGPPAIVRTDQGHVTADQVVLATNGYSTSLSTGTAVRVMPINNFIVATEPLGAQGSSILNQGHCAYDSRFVVNYFRMSEDGRLLFGGGENYGYRFPTDIATRVRKPLEQVFPQLRGVGIDYAWGGTLAITMSRLPYLARPAPHICVAGGYSGTGVALATLLGKMMAQGLGAQSEGLDLLERLPTPAFPGGGALRTPLLALAMTWYGLRDRLGV
jgi:gamma-glutamylputrescine oxidase